MTGKRPVEQPDAATTASLIESVLRQRRERSIIVNPDYLDDEKLTEEERERVLRQIFDRNIREKQLRRLISHLTPILDNEPPPAALIYGPTGSGKTVSSIHVLTTFQEVTRSHGVLFRYAYVDISSPKTYFSALNAVAMALDSSIRRYRKGIPIESMQESIVKALSGYGGFLCLLIDEVDNVRPAADQFLTFLAKTLPRLAPCRICLVMLTNRLDWEKALDPRILSFLKKSDLIFEPYDAMDLVALLRLRVEKSLDVSKVEEDAIHKVAAYASRETGDARKAVELLTKAVHIAENSCGRVTQAAVDEAEKKLEVDKTEELISALAVQQRLALVACYALLTRGHDKLTTGQAYRVYQQLCRRDQHAPLSQRRFSDLLSFLDLYGLINAQILSKGRYGNTREITRTLPEALVGRLLRIYG